MPFEKQTAYLHISDDAFDAFDDAMMMMMLYDTEQG